MPIGISYGATAKTECNGNADNGECQFGMYCPGGTAPMPCEPGTYAGALSHDLTDATKNKGISECTKW
jgi:hypothetical protein